MERDPDATPDLSALELRTQASQSLRDLIWFLDRIDTQTGQIHAQTDSADTQRELAEASKETTQIRSLIDQTRGELESSAIPEHPVQDHFANSVRSIGLLTHSLKEHFERAEVALEGDPPLSDLTAALGVFGMVAEMQAAKVDHSLTLEGRPQLGGLDEAARPAISGAEQTTIDQSR